MCSSMYRQETVGVCGVQGSPGPDLAGGLGPDGCVIAESAAEVPEEHEQEALTRCRWK